jgi:cold shock CspA family protein
MGRSQETAGKKEKEKKKAQKKKEKVERAEERKANSSKGKSLDDMMAYVDDDGNITSTPPDPRKKKVVINHEDIQIGVAKRIEEVRETVRNGVVTFFNDAKGYGFINDLQSQESVFVHINQLSEPIKEKDKVTFETEQGAKGLNAIKVKKVV